MRRCGLLESGRFQVVVSVALSDLKFARRVVVELE